MDMNVFQKIPAQIRQRIYLTLATVALLLSALEVADVTSLWGFATVKALAVVGFLAAPFGLTAAANTNTTPPTDSGGMDAGYLMTAGDDTDRGDTGATTADRVMASALALLIISVVLLTLSALR